MTAWIKETFRPLWRLPGWTLLAVGAVLGVLAMAPQQTGVMLYKLALVAVGSVFAYGLDRALFSRSGLRIDSSLPRDVVGAARILARAIIAWAVINGVTGGL